MSADPTAGPPSDESTAAPAAASSTGSSAASEFFAADGHGPTFDGSAEERPDAPELAPDPAAADAQPGWDRATVESILIAKGAVLHGLVGVAEGDWAYTADELRAIAPPLTRILNRYSITATAAGTGDELALMIGLGGYVTRSYRERERELERRAASEPAQGTQPPPVPAAPGATEGQPWSA